MTASSQAVVASGVLPSDASPEQRFLLDLLKQPSPAARERLQAAMAQISWPRVLELVTFSLHPYLDHAIERHGLADRLPAGVTSDFHASRKDAVLRYLRRKHEMKSVLEMLKEKQVEVIALKGLALAEMVYPVPATRHMQDVDLLVRPEQLDAAVALLKEQGFQAKQDPRLRMRSPDTDIFGADRSLAKVWPNDVLMIEIHTHLPLISPTARHEEAELWQRAWTWEGNGWEMGVLHPHDELILLCMHLGFQHSFERCLLWLLDVRLWLERWGPSMDWDGFASRCRRWQVESYVYLTLCAVLEWLEAEAARPALERLERPAHADEIMMLVWEQTWHSKLAVPPPKFLFQAVSRDAGRGFWVYLRERSRAWRVGFDPLHGRPETGLQFFWLRLWSDATKLGTAIRLGAFGSDNLRRARLVAARRERLSRLLDGPT